MNPSPSICLHRSRIKLDSVCFAAVLFLGIHNFTWTGVSYDNSVLDSDLGVLVPEKELARLTVRPASK
jgi:hypothetical protein